MLCQGKNKSYNLLIVSSFMFLLPAQYAYSTKQYFYMIVTIITAFVSILNWWYYHERNKSLLLDIFVARLSFIIYFLSGCIYIKSYFLFLVGFVNGINCLMFYILGNLCERHIEISFCHFLFHLCVIIGKIIVLYGIQESHIAK